MTHERNDGKTHEKDEARTPKRLFKILDDRYHFVGDVAATQENKLCGLAYSKDQFGAFVLPWFNVSYCNPPYSRGNIDAFCKKAYEESLKGVVVVMLLPMDSSTQWFHKYCSKAYKWIIFTPRVKFLHPNGTPFEGSPKFGSFACVFDEAGRKSISSPLIEFIRWNLPTPPINTNNNNNTMEVCSD